MGCGISNLERPEETGSICHNTVFPLPAESSKHSLVLDLPDDHDHRDLDSNYSANLIRMSDVSNYSPISTNHASNDNINGGVNNLKESAGTTLQEMKNEAGRPKDKERGFWRKKVVIRGVNYKGRKRSSVRDDHRDQQVERKSVDVTSYNEDIDDDDDDDQNLISDDIINGPAEGKGDRQTKKNINEEKGDDHDQELIEEEDGVSHEQENSRVICAGGSPSFRDYCIVYEEDSDLPTKNQNYDGGTQDSNSRNEGEPLNSDKGSSEEATSTKKEKRSRGRFMNVLHMAKPIGVRNLLNVQRSSSPRDNLHKQVAQENA